MLFSTDRLHQRAVELGFNLVGVSPAQRAPHLDAYLRWINAGMHGSMSYMARPDRQSRRKDLNVILPGVQSIILVGLDYHALSVPTEVLQDSSRGRIASYAWGVDYHDIMTPRLEQLAEWLQTETPKSVTHRAYVDTGAILERDHAQQTGMGFIGKNTMLIHPRRGSYFFLGEILTDLQFDTYDTPGRATMCGTCTKCLVACPTDAFPKPYVLDARRCISYLSIEHKGWIDRDLRPLMGNWVFGCDICQDVCPWQRFAVATKEIAFYPADYNRAAPPLLELLAITADAFPSRYEGTPIYRIKRHRLVRNACVAAGNWGDPQAIEPLQRLLDDEHPLVRGHAAWALGRILGQDAKTALTSHYDREQNAEVKHEMQLALEGV